MNAVKTLVRNGSFDKVHGSIKGKKEKEEEKQYSLDVNDYERLKEIGRGGGAIVYKGRYKPCNEIVALKVFDLERMDQTLDDIRKEVTAMRMIHHHAVVRAYCSFVVERSLWIVMPFMSAGSALRIMEVAFKNGLEEDAIATILKEVATALDYVHSVGRIHRDVKAGNVLVDANGTVKLADFGVSAFMFDTGDRRNRNTFTGTPQWMAPEVIEQLDYDFKADIWSFGITALELAHGQAPFAKFPPMKVLMKLLSCPPPCLDAEGDKDRFGKSFRDLIGQCLCKDPSERPTAERLLKHPFFKHHARGPEYLVRNVLSRLPPLGDDSVKAAA
eukprot:TRINITY_DN6306_c0_g1_i1.p1 TRINITY_DN6306_c0_g1~~TRINITY_DN6306_c0_g1_i1.p1  ORF type:complete len:330 (+),score=81.82 TRINITY_DN6306_c0_g1_i1:83-1072(+)